ncbi:MAG: exosortase family protein XrtF [Bacteroidota bacterium]
MTLLTEFKRPILFLVKFIVLYFVLNLCYGLFVDYYSPSIDPFTDWVAENTAFVLRIIGYSVDSVPSNNMPHSVIKQGPLSVISVFEGCNGINIAIIFASFIFVFSKPNAKMIWFILLGLIVIHITNLIRICLLFYVAINLEDYFYFTHKYFFTAIIYVVVFVMWYIWVSKIAVSAD